MAENDTVTSWSSAFTRELCIPKTAVGQWKAPVDRFHKENPLAMKSVHFAVSMLQCHLGAWQAAGEKSALETA